MLLPEAWPHRSTWLFLCKENQEPGPGSEFCQMCPEYRRKLLYLTLSSTAWQIIAQWSFLICAFSLCVLQLQVGGEKEEERERQRQGERWGKGREGKRNKEGAGRGGKPLYMVWAMLSVHGHVAWEVEDLQSASACGLQQGAHPHRTGCATRFKVTSSSHIMISKHKPNASSGAQPFRRKTWLCWVIEIWYNHLLTFFWHLRDFFYNLTFD